MTLNLEFITNLERFKALEDNWNRLLPCNAIDEIFLTWQWQSTWWTAYEPGDLWVMAAYDNGQLVGIAPWFREAESHVIRPIGCVEVTDYLDILVMPEYREAFCEGLADCLLGQREAFSRINLCNNPAGSPTLVALPRALQARGFSVNIREQEVCPHIQLPRSFEDYLNQLDKKQRHEARRKMRRMENDDAKIEWYIVGPKHDLDAEIERFVHLMASSHSDKARFLHDPKNMAFFRAIVHRVSHCGWLQLAFLVVDDEPAAAYLNFDYANRIMVYNSGLAPDRYAHLSPGIVLLLYLVQHAIELGRSEFDFLRGNEEYKYRMGGQDRPVMEIQARFEN